MKAKRVLAVHDLCSFGRCSLTAAIPVISAMGMQVCPFPTALFSNNLTYGEFTFHDFTDKMTGFMDRWEKLGFQYDAVYSGFLASVEQIEVVRDAVKRFASKKGALVVVDPAMGDDGKLYPVFGPEYVEAMRTLVKEATLITPNFTEACFLLDESCDMTAPSAGKLRFGDGRICGTHDAPHSLYDLRDGRRLYERRDGVASARRKLGKRLGACDAVREPRDGIHQGSGGGPARRGDRGALSQRAPSLSASP